jgi:hypothetical protein
MFKYAIAIILLCIVPAFARIPETGHKWSTAEPRDFQLEVFNAYDSWTDQLLRCYQTTLGTLENISCNQIAETKHQGVEDLLMIGFHQVSMANSKLGQVAQARAIAIDTVGMRLLIQAHDEERIRQQHSQHQ